MTTQSITDMGIIQMLATVLGGKVPENNGSTRKRSSKENQRGVITSVLARQLFTANSIMTGYINGLIEEHNHLHEDCEAFTASVSRLSARKDLLHGLLWQAITEEYPEVAANRAAIREGWLLVDKDGEWNEAVPVPDKSSVANNFVSRVSAIVCGKRVSVKKENLDPVAHGEEVIGSLDDERVQTLRTLDVEISDEFLKRLPLGIADRSSEIIGNMTVVEMNHLHVLVTHFKTLSDLASSLFWCGVRDTVPAAADLPRIGIRQDWQVVKCIPDKDPKNLEMVMTPMGLAIAIKVSIPNTPNWSFGGGVGTSGLN